MFNKFIYSFARVIQSYGNNLWCSHRTCQVKTVLFSQTSRTKDVAKSSYCCRFHWTYWMPIGIQNCVSAMTGNASLFYRQKTKLSSVCDIMNANSQQTWQLRWPYSYTMVIVSTKHKVQIIFPQSAKKVKIYLNRIYQTAVSINEILYK